MPGMDGIAPIQEPQKCRPGLRAVLLTGLAANAAEPTIRGTLSLLRLPLEQIPFRRVHRNG